LARTARTVPVLLLVAVIAIAIGVGVIVHHAPLSEKPVAQASTRGLVNGIASQGNTLSLKIDDDLAGFSARLPAAAEAR
jgi:hypothetical protein